MCYCAFNYSEMSVLSEIWITWSSIFSRWVSLSLDKFLLNVFKIIPCHEVEKLAAIDELSQLVPPIPWID